MNRSSLLLLAVVTLTAIAGGWFLSQQGSRDEQETFSTWFFEELRANPESLSQVQIAGAGNKTIATLELGDHGWVVVEKDHYPADETRLSKMLTTMAQAKVMEPKTDQPQWYSRLGVEDVSTPEAFGIRLDMRGESLHTSVIIGKLAHEIGGTYARKTDEARTVLLNQTIEPLRETARWLRPEIIDIPSGNIRSVQITHPDGEKLKLEKPDPGAIDLNVLNIPAGRELKYKAVASSVAGALAMLNLVEVARFEALHFESIKPVETIFQTNDGLEVTTRAYQRDDQSWLTFDVSAITREDSGKPGLSEASDSSSEDEHDGTQVAALEELVETTVETDSSTRAQKLQTKLAGWVYQIQPFKFQLLTRRMEDFLKPVETEADQT